MSTSVENVFLSFFFVPVHVWLDRGASVSRVKRQGKERETATARAVARSTAAPRRATRQRCVTLFMSLYNKYSGIPRLDISTATDNIQMYKYKNKNLSDPNANSAVRHEICSSFFSLLFVFQSPFHTQTKSFWLSVENTSVSPICPRGSCRSLHLRHGTNTHHSCTHTHTPPHTRAIQFPVETERKYPLRKRKKKTETKKKINKYKPCCCLLYWCPFLTPSSAPAAGPLSQFRGPFSWRRRGRRRENYKLKQLYVSPAVDTQRSQVWFMVLAPTMRGK